MTGFIYKHPVFYRSTMKWLYGKDYEQHYKSVAELIVRGESVTELCMGDGYLYDRYLSNKEVDYTGLEINKRFIQHAKTKNINCIECDVAVAAIPKANVVLIQAGLYQFIPNAGEIVKRMVDAATRCVIIAEPIRNLSQSKNPVIRSVAKRSTNPGTGNTPKRFTEESLQELLNALGAFEYITGSKELIATLVK